jgi:KDO2-lipid IV(A) lauroyltransferase
LKSPTLEDRLEYWGVLVLAGIMRMLPRRSAVRLGAFLGRLAFDLAGFRREVALSNVRERLELGEPKRDGRAIAREAYANFGRSMAEFLLLPETRSGRIKAGIAFEGLHHLDSALAGGRGAVLVTGHFGSWELMGCALARLGYPLTYVVGVQRNPLVQDLMNRLREDCGIRVIEPTSLLATTRVLRQNRFIAMLSDQDAGPRGVFVDFLGRPASTPAGAARLALLTGAPLLTGFIVRSGSLQHRIVIGEPLRVDPSLKKEEAATELARAYTASIEKYVRKYPDHYLWAHRRWKTRPG